MSNYFFYNPPVTQRLYYLRLHVILFKNSLCLVQLSCKLLIDSCHFQDLLVILSFSLYFYSVNGQIFTSYKTINGIITGSIASIPPLLTARLLSTSTISMRIWLCRATYSIACYESICNE